jgi:hypothetical protein
MTALWLMAWAALAQDSQSEPATSTNETEALRERVRRLERSIDELRGTAEVSSDEIPLDLTTRLRGYGALNVNYLEEYKTFGFSVDEFVTQYQANLDRKMAITTELSFEAEEHGIDVGLEVLEMLVAPSPVLQFAAGQFHTPISPWAVTASQGAYRYPPTSVPEALEEEAFEEFLPIDQTGVQLRGQVPVGYWQFAYAAAVTNGRAPDPGSAAQQQDFHDFKALTGRLAVQSPGGFSLGAAGYFDLVDVHDETLLDGTEDEDEAIVKKTIIDNATETILGGSIGVQGTAVELNSEAYVTLHGFEGGSWTSFTGFAILSVPVDKTTPFLMADVVIVDPDDPVYQRFNQTGPEIEVLPGLRYDLGLHLAFKMQGEIAYELDSASVGWGVQGQLAAGF